MQHSRVLALAALALGACELLVPAPGTGVGPNALPAPELPPTSFAIRSVEPQQGASASPGTPILLRALPKADLPDGTRIITRGTLLRDIAAIDGRKGVLFDFVLDESPGSLRVATNESALAATRGVPQMTTGILRVADGRRVLEIESFAPIPETTIRNLTVDRRPREPNEQLAVTPGSHTLSVEAPGLAAVEFQLDPAEGPTGVFARDNTPGDGFSVPWSAVPDDRVHVLVVGFTLFDEPIDGPEMVVKVGPSM